MNRRYLAKDDELLLDILNDASLPEPEQVDHIFSAEYQREKKQLLGSATERYRWRPYRGVAAIVLLILLVSFTVNAERVISYIAEIGNSFWRLVSSYEEAEIGYNTTFVFPSMEPTYAPQDFIRDEIASGGKIVYEHEDGRYIVFSAMEAIQSTPSYDNEDYLVEQTTINEHMAMKMTSLTEEKGHMIVWMVDEMIFDLYGYVELEELIKMAESVKEVS